MSIKDYLKCINIQDLTTGASTNTIYCSRDTIVTCSIPLYMLELVEDIKDILKDEHNIAIKIGYKG